MMKARILAPLLLVALLCSSCRGDYHYGKQFLRKHKWHTPAATEQIYLCLPTQLYRTNSTESVPDSCLSPREADSIARHHNLLLSQIDDSIFLAQFRGCLVEILSHTRIPVVKVEEESLLPPPSKDCLILDITAIEAEEFVEHAQSGFTTKRGMAYLYDHDLRHFSTNIWLQMNYDTCYFFLNQELGEEAGFQGTILSVRNGQARMSVKRVPLTVNDAYETARSLGQLCGRLYIEKILLEYVHSKRGKNRWYMFYNEGNNSVDVMVPYEAGLQGSFEVFTP